MIIDYNIKKAIQKALKEDIGARDITTTSILPKTQKGEFAIIAKSECVICGLNFAALTFEMVNNTIGFKPTVKEGKKVPGGYVVAYVKGGCWAILSAERTALNILSWLSGTATLTNRFVEEVKGTKAQILDTRKTIPGLRAFQKYAVLIGGGANHRMGLYDQILIKDNHISAVVAASPAIKGKKDAVELLLKKARRYGPRDSKVEVEVDSLDIFKVALELNPDIIMLDNMSTENIEKAVQIRDNYRVKIGDVGLKTLLEVSGNVGLYNVREIAECGVDMISIGALTHSAASIDISLELR